MLIAFTSCNDYLDKIPDTRVYLENVEQLRQLMVDGYNSYSLACVGELSSDNVIDNNSPSDDGVRYNKAPYSVADNQLYAWEDVTLDNGSDTPSGIWEGCYGAIAVCNAVLEKVAQFEAEGADANGALSPEDRAKLSAVKGEALVSRAYHHWVLCNFFCPPYYGEEGGTTLPGFDPNSDGITYITEPETTVMPDYKRESLISNYKKIEADLEAGLPLINDLYYEVPKYHFNKAAAYAFAARFYLYKRDYPKAEEYATLAFKGNDPATMMSPLWMITSFYYISDIGRGATTIKNANVWMCFNSYSTWWRRFVYSTQNRYTTNREAARGTLRGPGPTWDKCLYSSAKTKETFAMHPCFNGYCGSAGGQEYGMYFAGTCFEQFEYTNKIAGIGYCHAVRAEFTTEQNLLVRAEARLFMGDIDGAFEDLNTWDAHRQHNASSDDRMVPLSKENIVSFYTKMLNAYTKCAGRYEINHYQDSIQWGIARPINIDKVCPSNRYHVTPEIEPYLQCVQHFLRLENVHTGMRWWDIRRFGLDVTHKIGRSEIRELKWPDTRYVIQIPYETVAAGYQPNPTYKKSTQQAIGAVAVEAPGSVVRVN